MKVKEVERTANIAWSPAQQYPIYMATATAAQQLDATFSTSAALELFAVNLSEPSIEMELVSSMDCETRFHKLLWGWSEQPGMGLLYGGADNGKVYIWDVEKLSKKADCVVECVDKHKGPVRALDINPIARNLFATGASDSDIFIWDLNNMDKPSAPGQKSLPPDDVTCLAWNHQVQHILASTFAGRCVVWDLKKNEPIIRIPDSMSRIKSKLVAWHPEVPTQMCLASEDDHTPVIQLWDLRYATSPHKVFEGHTRGVLSMAWCPQDADLLLTCGKDNRILCWNPNTQGPMGEIVYELRGSDQWCFDVQWCPRNPNLISTCSFDSQISVYSLTGGAPPTVTRSSTIAESFSDPSGSYGMDHPTSHSVSASGTTEPPVILKKPPKWLRRPVGASFAFGGQLVSFADAKVKSAPGMQHQQAVTVPIRKEVFISQVVTESDLVLRSRHLEQALAEGKGQEFCAMKVATSRSKLDERIWKFLKVHFEDDTRKRYLELLGYTDASIASKVSELLGKNQGDDLSEAMAGVGVGDLVRSPSDSNISSSSSAGPGDDFEHIGRQQENSRSDILAFATKDNAEGLVTKALLTGNFEVAVDLCLHTNRTAEAIILAVAGGPSLAARTHKKFFARHKDPLNKLLSCLVNRDFESIMQHCDLANWREALAMALTYSKVEQLPSLCDVLGQRLESCEDPSLAVNACLCYVCAGNVQQLVSCWGRLVQGNNETPLALQDLVEKAMVLRQAMERNGQAVEMGSGQLASKLSQYAGLLAAQGCFQTAMSYLGNSQEAELAVLRDRLYYSLPTSTAKVPTKPFQVENITGPSQPKPQVQQPSSQRQRASSGLTQPVQPMSVTQPTYYNHVQPVVQPAPYTVPTVQPGQYTVPTIQSNQYSGQGQPSTYPGPTMYNPQTAKPDGRSVGQQQPNYPNMVNSYTAPVYNNTQSVGGQYPGTYTSGQVSNQYTGTQGNLYNPATVSAQPTAASSHLPSTMSNTAAPLNNPEAYRSQETSWNDPPIIERKANKAASNPAKVMSLFNPAQPQEQQQQQQQQQPTAQDNYIGNTHIYNPQEYQPQPSPAPAPQPAQPVEKGPIPVEHEVLHQVFNGLADVCMARASNPHIKKKLDEVHRKLDVLYDKLREQTLSAFVLENLHLMVNCIRAADYPTAIAYQNHMIGQCNFSEISGFMPGIKMLLQTASQMNVSWQG